MQSRRISRRRLGQLLAAAWPALPGPGWAQSFDQGIGGTGVVGDPKDEPSDQMIGGTGVIGTIRRFGSIYVNGMRIAYAPTLPVSMGGTSVSVDRLRLGQVVRVATMVGPGPLIARSIAVEHEVVGPIEALQSDRMTVLGQTVSLDGSVPSPPLTVGAPVAVSGLRRLDGSIAASLIETSANPTLSVAGPLVRGTDGAFSIGALRIANLAPALAGQRVRIDGRMTGAMFRATRVVAERTDLARLGTSRFSIEGYVGHEGSGLRLGSGLQLGSAVSAQVPDEPAVVIVVLTEHQRLVAEKIESETDVATTSRQTRDTERAARSRQERGERGASKHGSDSGSGHGGGSHGHR